VWVRMGVKGFGGCGCEGVWWGLVVVGGVGWVCYKGLGMKSHHLVYSQFQIKFFLLFISDFDIILSKYI
jgi:hypothetical protein